MMSKDLLKQIGIIGVSFGLAASPLAFGQSTNSDDIADQNSVQTNQPPAAQATESASDPTQLNDQDGTLDQDMEAAQNQDQMPAATSTDSASNPMQKEDQGGSGMNEGDVSSHEYEPDMDEMSPEAESTGSASNPAQ
ncbi:hypothetical protein [Pistricoccus aurantiacus]|uniref:hypothetical protein n=1 Tax=Pistricoccus aurantiacus TaxID=1883414 RepID=UPI0036409C41